MPSYVRAGSVPHKRHIQFRRPDGGLYAEELFSTKGFESSYSLLYHLRPPTATLDVRPWNRPEVRYVPNDPLRNRHFRTAALEVPASDAVASRIPVLGNADMKISVAQADRPMEYWYRNTGGDEMLFVHHGAGVLETQFGELAYRERDYLIIPTGAIYRLIPASPTRLLVHESIGEIKIPRRYRNEYGQLEEHAPYYERDFRVPVLQQPQAEQGEYEIRVTNAGRNAIYIVQNHPSDVVGW
ncbi:MAG TPA: homogentisate 1,2-dioxygenase, partial [Candidatus Acidoferrum sp.]|nr:homogentisate 1,2-dioxygenase [Candidatus Acidoferrum sp.]